LRTDKAKINAPEKTKPDSFAESGFWDTMYSTLLQHYLQKHITQDARKPDGFDENDDMFQLLTCCKYMKSSPENRTFFANYLH
jgi:hypothetical protein